MRDEKPGEWVSLGTAAVDSGQLLIVDPCYVREDYSYEDITFRDEYDEKGSRCTPDGQVEKGSLRNLAVKFDPGFGDGSYEVLARYEDHGDWGRRCAEVRIICIPEDDIDG